MIVYDTAMLVAADRNQPEAMLRHRGFLALGHEPVVPAGVLAQAWRGGPQPTLSRMLASCHVAAMTEDLARACGRLCAESGVADIVDASVVAIASRIGAAIITGDVDDIRRIVDVAGIPLHVQKM